MEERGVDVGERGCGWEGLGGEERGKWQSGCKRGTKERGRGSDRRKEYRSCERTVVLGGGII